LYTAIVRKQDAAVRNQLVEFGQYVAECMPKYVQQVQITGTNELEVLIAPEGVVPILQFLKDHHNCQFASLADIAGMDVPTRQFRFEVRICHVGINLLVSAWICLAEFVHCNA